MQFQSTHTNLHQMQAANITFGRSITTKEYNLIREYAPKLFGNNEQIYKDMCVVEAYRGAGRLINLLTKRSDARRLGRFQHSGTSARVYTLYTNVVEPVESRTAIYPNEKLRIAQIPDTQYALLLTEYTFAS